MSGVVAGFAENEASLAGSGREEHLSGKSREGFWSVGGVWVSEWSLGSVTVDGISGEAPELARRLIPLPAAGRPVGCSNGLWVTAHYWV